MEAKRRLAPENIGAERRPATENIGAKRQRATGTIGAKRMRAMGERPDGKGAANGLRRAGRPPAQEEAHTHTPAQEEVHRRAAEMEARSRSRSRSIARVGVISGPPSCGKTETVIRLALGGRGASVIVAHFSAIADVCARIAALGAPVAAVGALADIEPAAQALAQGGFAVAVCTDLHYAPLMEAAARHGASLERTVFDSAEALAVRRRAPPEDAGFMWYVISMPLESIGERFWTLIGGRAEESSIEFPPGSRAFGGAPECEKRLYRVPDDRVMIEAAKRLFAAGENETASACLPGIVVDSDDADKIFGDRIRGRLEDNCPVCLEPAGDADRRRVPMAVAPLCGHVFCAACLCSLGPAPPCPLCRAPLCPAACMFVARAPVPYMTGAVSVMRRTIAECLAEAGSKTLVVAGVLEGDDITGILTRADIRFVDLCGNRSAMRRRIEEFAAPGACVALARSHLLELTGLRLPALTNVVFFGSFSRESVDYWTTRSAAPAAPRLPRAIAVEAADPRFNGI